MSSASDQLHQHLVLGPIHTRVSTIQKQYREVQGDDDVAEEFAHLSWLDCDLMLERVPVDNAHVREIPAFGRSIPGTLRESRGETSAAAHAAAIVHTSSADNLGSLLCYLGDLDRRT